MQRHATDLLSLFAGCFFLAAGSLLLSHRVDLLGDLRWAGPVLLIVVALAMLASLRTRSYSRGSAWRDGDGARHDPPRG